MARKDPRPDFPDGVLVIDKPAGPTSHDVVTIVRRALGVSRVGHTGTLDPMATGVLPVVIGRATRLAQFLTASDKDYVATLAFGTVTDSYDALGQVVATSEQRPKLEHVEQTLATFRGTFDQRPPVYSAKNIEGERAYDRARRKKQPVRPKATRVTAQQLELIAFDGETAQLAMRVTAGFYVRSLVHDLGERLGTGAVLTALRRMRAGEFDLDESVTLASVIESGRSTLAHHVIRLPNLLPAVPAVTLRTADTVSRVKNGVEVAPEDLLRPADAAVELVRLIGPDGTLVGLARPGKTPGCLHASVVLA